ncbi:MAG: hypothetical protein LBB67_00180 [Oscillospiraceae bacterium]|nr:hypothetical protein [Oscillospiraceae bacterium]
MLRILYAKTNFKPSQYRRALARGCRVLNRAYKNALRGKEGRGGEAYHEWLRDNYYMIERESIAAQTDLAKMMHATGFGDLLCVCAALAQGGVLPDEKTLTAGLKRAALSAAQAEQLPLALRCVITEAAIASCGERVDGLFCCIPAQNETVGLAMISAAVRSLRQLPEVDFVSILEQVNPLERILRREPSGVYPRMDEESRAVYRALLAKRAKRERLRPEICAKRLLDESGMASAGSKKRHFGGVLLDETRHPRRGKALLFAETVLPVAFSGAIALLTRQWLLLFLLIMPLWGILRIALEAIFLRGINPTPLPRLAFGGNVPAEGRTLVTVSSLLPEAAKSRTLRRRMEELHGSNGGKHVTICVLADLKAAVSAVCPQDEVDLAAAEREVRELNQKYGGGFLLCVRHRVFSPTMRHYAGWERKRGAILQLTRLICNDPDAREAFLCVCGDESHLHDYKYMLALDSDTQLPMDTVAEMAAAALHPVNQAVFDPAKGRVTEGYGIIVPSIGLDLESTRRTPFAHAMAGEGGISPYENHVGERYQDLFGSSIFAGKGLIDIAAFRAVAAAHPFKEEQVLSHDILEGGYLRTGFLADVQLSDGFPAKQSSYFARLERWIRGDWQNIAFLRKKYGLPWLARYQLFDNLRRSIAAPACVSALLLSLFLPREIAWITAILSVLGVSGGYWVAALRSLSSGGAAMLSRAYFSGGVPAGLGDLMRGILQIVMLAQNAWVSCCAAVRALWRSFVSGKKRLEWVTAAQSDAARVNPRAIAALLPSALCGALLFYFGTAGVRLLGILMILNVPFALFSANETKRGAPKMREDAAARAMGYCALMWKYFENYCTREHNYLPPDNVQEAPVFRVAARTSPTNMGLFLLCVLAARDLGFITPQEMAERLDRSLRGIERLERWHGNLLNWYDTRTLRPLEPRYVSTVDSGNFLCSLRTLRQGLCAYQAQDPSIVPIIERLTALEESCDLRPLYHHRRKLFHIGMDLSTGKLSQSYYDLFMSEARMTGYYAIATRMIPKKHWGALGRTLARFGRFVGPVSWTGTMFEYFMPYLFLPAPKGSLGYEALRFCLVCQKKRLHSRAHQGLPWGISESGFYAFDSSCNYQYKAHGVQKLGLRRGLDEELVLAPYASFLAMQLAPNTAAENLAVFEKMELLGACGFYEAADATPRRACGQDYAVVRSYMAHHVGMSMLSALNALQDGILRKRFMSDKAMESAKGLLNERIPDRAPVFRDVELRETPMPRERLRTPRTILEHPNPSDPNGHLLTNGEWSTMITDVGASVSYYRGVSLLRGSPDLLRRACGVFAFVRQDGASALSVTPAPRYARNGTYKVEFAQRRVIHSVQGTACAASMTTTVHPRRMAEERRFEIKNTSKSKTGGTVLVYFEPSLTSAREEADHPMFSKLFLTDDYDQKQNVLTFTRENGKTGESIALAAGLSAGVFARVEASRQRLSGRAALLGDIRLQETCHRGNPDACAAFEVDFSLQANETLRFSLFMCAGTTAQEAKQRLLRLRGEQSQNKWCAGKTVWQAKQRSLRLRGEQSQNKKPWNGAPCPFRQGELSAVLAQKIMPQLLFFTNESSANFEARAKNRASKSHLWSVGVSGDVPYIYAAPQNENELQAIAPYLKVLSRLRMAGVPCALVIGISESGAYEKPMQNALMHLLRREDCLHLLGLPDGVLLADISRANPSVTTALEAYASHCVGHDAQTSAADDQPFYAMPILASQSKTVTADGVRTGGAVITSDAIIIKRNTSLPDVPWCFPLANRSFGTLVSDQSLGCTWAINARENKLSPWDNDPCADNRGELLLLRFGDKVYDMLLGSSARFSPQEVCWSGGMHGVTYTVRVRIPTRGCAKQCAVSLKNTTDRAIAPALCYYFEPVLGVRRAPDAAVLGEALPDGAILYAPNAAIKGYCALQMTGGADFVCADRAMFWQGKWHTTGAWPRADACAAVGRKLQIAPHETCEAEFILSWGAQRNAALCAHLVAVDGNITQASIRVQTEYPELDAMINTWLPHQIIHSRLFGRMGFAQCGGAWGFRDQLQDAAALIPTHPQLCRVQLARCAAVQFTAGDVLHWWHRIPGDGIRGARTRYADDLLWMPYVAAQYVSKTGNRDILHWQIAFLQGEPLEDGETERYAVYACGGERASFYEHCLRAIDFADGRMGAHGLPLIGGGDWNDGFQLIGIKGRGESVWLGFFLAMVLEEFAPVCETMGDAERADTYRAKAARLRERTDAHAWAGDRYLRAFWDDGEPLGGVNASACAIDSLAQSFAVLSGMPDKDRRAKALQTAMDQLVDEQYGIVRLLYKPFGKQSRRAGYINDYPPGVRENGGQYTHAAVWFAMAMLRDGRTADGWRLLQTLNPAYFCRNREQMERYQGEPYAMAGDVSGAPGIKGRAGWTLYTGAAGWYYRAVLEELLGLRMENGVFRLEKQETAEAIGGAIVFVETENGKERLIER